jgi:hypothetical protein
MTVIGIRTKPAAALAMAPVVRFARFDSCGSEDDDGLGGMAVPGVTLAEGENRDAATCWRRAFRVVKYSAEPRPVRITEGRAPRQSCWMVLGDEDISRKVASREGECVCCTRVFNRSAGWRRAAEVMPVTRPARK